ncbi:MAG: hypothetical protein U0935_23270 [Pirellulales bacterium]
MAGEQRIPLWAKGIYSAFVGILVPIYWRDYGPTNFLYFCDVALLITLVALWTERPLLASMPAVGILLPQALWCVDFLATLAGYPLVGLTGYMFDDRYPLLTRQLSFFHFWLPFVLAWLVWRLGYDRRALAGWGVLATVLVLFCYLAMPAPPAPPDQPNLPVNINYVYGLSDQAPQSWFHPHLYVLVLLLVLNLGIFLPTHWLLVRFAPSAALVPIDRGEETTG